MPLIEVKYDKDKLNAALTCSAQRKPSQLKALLTEMFEAAQAGLVKHVGEAHEAVAFEAIPFEALVVNRYPLEFILRTTKSRDWGDKGDTDEVVRKLIKRMEKVLRRWRDDGRLAFKGWQISVELTFIDKFVAGDPID